MTIRASIGALCSGRICALRMLVAGCSLSALSVAPALAADRLEIVSLSNRADKISGGEMLALVRVPASIRLSNVTVRLNGRDVTAAFWPAPASHALMGLVAGMHLGTNRLEARARGVHADTLRIRN